jgi:hypothetical protein
MECASFARLLTASIGDDESTRTEAFSLLSSFQERNFPAFLDFLSSLIFSPLDSFSQRAAITTLYRQAVSNPSLFLPSLITEFWPLFGPSLPSFLADALVPPHFRTMVMDTLCIAALRAGQAEHIYFHQFLLEFSNSPACEPFILHTISAMICASNSLSGFPLSLLHQMLVNPRADDSALPRLSLFFAVAKHDSSDAIHSLFQAIMESVSGATESAVSLLLDICDRCPAFLVRHFAPLIEWVCARIGDDHKPSRGPAMMLLGALGSCAPFLWVEFPILYHAAIDSLLSVMTEPVSEAENIAQDALAQLLESANSAEILNYFFDAHARIIANQLDFGAAYAFFTALEALPFTITSELIARVNCITTAPSVDALFETILMAATDDNAPIPLRIAALRAFGHLIRQMTSMTATPERVLRIVTIFTTTGSDLPLLLAAADALNDCMIIRRRAGIGDAIPVVLALAMEGLTLADCPLKFAFVQITVNLVEMLREAALPLLPQIMGVLEGGLTGASVAARVKTVNALCQILRVLENCVPPVDQAMIMQFMAVACDAWRVLEVDDDLREDASNAMRGLLHWLGDASAPFVQVVVPELLADATRELIVQELPLFADAMSLSFLMRASGERQFVLKSDVHAVKQCLTLLASFLVASPAAFAEFGERALEAILELLTREPAVEALDLHCWTTFNRLIGAFPSVTAPVVIRAWLDVYRMNSFEVLSESTRAVNDALATLTFPDDSVPALLERGAAVFCTAVCALHAALNAERLAAVPARAEEAAEGLDPIAEYFAYFLERHTAQTAPFFVNNLDNGLRECLAFPGCQQIAVLLYGAYMSATGDGACLALLASVAEAFDVNAMERLMLVLWRFFERFPVDQDTALSWYHILVTFLTTVQLADELNEILSDRGLFAISWLLRRNRAHFDLNRVVPEWEELFPIWILHDEADVVYALLADFIEEGQPHFADPQVLGDQIKQIIRARVLEDCSSETSARLLAIIARFAQDSETAQIFREIWASTNVEDQEHLQKFLGSKFTSEITGNHICH